MKILIPCGIIGFGNVGRAILEQLRSMTKTMRNRGIEWDIEWIAKRNGVYDASLSRQSRRDRCMLLSDTYTQRVSVVFIAMPSTGVVEDEYHFMRHFARKCIPVVTCTKAALAFQGQTLMKYRRFLRFSPSVSGNVSLLTMLAETAFPIVEIHGVFNATLNTLRQCVLRGMSLAHAVSFARKEQLVEPNSSNLADTLNGELRDMLLKALILVNFLNREKRGILSVPTQCKLSAQFPCAFREAFETGLVCTLRIARNGIEPAPERLRKIIFAKKTGGWHIALCFEHPKLLPFEAPTDARNAIFYRTEGNEWAVASGIGAGPQVIAGSMICEALHMIRTTHAVPSGLVA